MGWLDDIRKQLSGYRSYQRGTQAEADSNVTQKNVLDQADPYQETDEEETVRTIWEDFQDRGTTMGDAIAPQVEPDVPTHTIEPVAGLPPEVLGPEDPMPISTDGQPVTPTMPTAVQQAAQLLGGAVAGNPWIRATGRARLASGLVPDLNMINPQFWSGTDPEIANSMYGLLQSVGQRQGQVQHAFGQWRPTGLY